jgi:hypothetical protein
MMFAMGPGSSLSPLVFGSPRTGFSLLCSIAAELNPLAPRRFNVRDALRLDAMTLFGPLIAKAIVGVFDRHGLSDRMLFNKNFQHLVGGPKWVDPENPSYAVSRKYIGCKGLGDFMMSIRLPREALFMDDVIHSHYNPKFWLQDPAFSKHTKFASIRHPLGTIASSSFSLNALVSEYLQKSYPHGVDTEYIRQDMAMNKLTNIDIFKGIAAFYVEAMTELAECSDGYTIMRWEDLIDRPVETIMSLARSAGLSISEEFALSLWKPLDHVNLTGAHHHNYRQGKGIVGDWKNWLTNDHLDIMRMLDFSSITEHFGYPPIETIRLSHTTSFQRNTEKFIRTKTVYSDIFDGELFGYAFNKSNIKEDAFGFYSGGWRAFSRIERATFDDHDLMHEIQDDVEQAATKFWGILQPLTADGPDFHTPERARQAAQDVMDAIVDQDLQMPAATEAAVERFSKIIDRHFHPNGTPTARAEVRPPRLLTVRSSYNVVALGEIFVAVPIDLGPIDLLEAVLEDIPGLLRAASFEGVLELVDVHLGRRSQPRLVFEKGAMNFVEFLGVTWRIPQSTGAIDFTRIHPNLVESAHPVQETEIAERAIPNHNTAEYSQ